jgi:DNA-binding GntR family transcriptional regulator
VLETTSAALEKRARFYFSTVAHELGADWLHVHEQLLELVETRDGDGAAKLAEAHIRNTGMAVRALLFADEPPRTDGTRVPDRAPRDVPTA